MWLKSVGTSLKEYILALGYWGWVVAVGLAYSITTMVLDITNTKEFPLWAWLIPLLVAVIIVPFIIFHKMRVERDRLKDVHHIGIVYNENYPECRQVSDKLEMFRLGIRVVGNKSIGNIEVFPGSLEDKNNKRIEISRTRLQPMDDSMLMKPVNAGLHPTCFVNLFMHVIGGDAITIMYEKKVDNHLLKLEKGEYQLFIYARGDNNEHGFTMLNLHMDDDYNITLETDRSDDRWMNF